MSTLDDEAREIRQIASGNQEAFAALYDRYSSRIYYLLIKMLQNKAEAEEELQEVFLVFWKTSDRFDPKKSSIKSWLQIIARRKAIDRLRGRKHRPQTAAEEDASLRAERLAAKQNPEEDAQQEQRSRNIETALSKLTEKQRETLELTYFKGLSSYEIAKQLQVPVGTIKSRLRDSLQKLRRFAFLTSFYQEDEM